MAELKSLFPAVQSFRGFLTLCRFSAVWRSDRRKIVNEADNFSVRRRELRVRGGVCSRQDGDDGAPQ